MHPAFLYLPGRRLSLTELSAARLDGHVVEVGDAYIPADLPAGPEVRAASLAPLIQTGAAASGPSAAWVHGAGDAAPTPHHVRRAVTRRLRPMQSPRVRYHDTVLPDEDVITLAGVRVTTVERTLADLALAAHRDGTLHPWLTALGMLDPAATRSALGRVQALQRVPGSRGAIVLLEALVTTT